MSFRDYENVILNNLMNWFLPLLRYYAWEYGKNFISPHPSSLSFIIAHSATRYRRLYFVEIPMPSCDHARFLEDFHYQAMLYLRPEILASLPKILYWRDFWPLDLGPQEFTAAWHESGYLSLPYTMLPAKYWSEIWGRWIPRAKMKGELLFTSDWDQGCKFCFEIFDILFITIERYVAI
jgi:hypothetical protein